MIKIARRYIAMALALFVLSGCNGSVDGVVETRNTGSEREGFVQTTGGRVWFRIAGADKKAVPLLVVSGGPGAPHDYLEPLEALSDERPVIFYDQLGCGNSDKVVNKELWTIGSYVDELSNVRKALKLKKVHILGQSWGAALAVEYMLLEKKPKGVLSLILSGPVLNARRYTRDQKEYARRDFNLLGQQVIEKAEKDADFTSKEYKEVAGLYNKLHLCRLKEWPEPLKRTMDKINKDIRDRMLGPGDFSVTGTLKDYDATGRLSEIMIPTLFTCGRLDKSTPETTAEYRNRMPGAELSVFEDASHMHHLEKTDEYIAVARSFLKRAEDIAEMK